MNETLVNFRNKKGMSQVQFARKIGVSTSYLSKIELGDRQPSFGFMRKFKKAFNEADIDKIFFDN
ncbi:helix-turn-helix transcriptional regulator [Terrisporobacter glycolicus]|uniref:HTH cro/C1-type domain-containing protein n=1 Tax=Terrisporobacter glycolicus ATCC 14880 = DSM 1288 TaxID=1121315 RepID=A0ABZ2EXH2_9FIRM|nr:helix-turn-helix transcriptional regulator [Terrisporobacter glycolicus]